MRVDSGIIEIVSVVFVRWAGKRVQTGGEQPGQNVGIVMAFFGGQIRAVGLEDQKGVLVSVPKCF